MMQASDPSSSVRQDPLERLAMQQEGYEILAQRKVDAPNEDNETLQAWQQVKQEEMDHMMSAAEAYDASHYQSSHRLSDLSVSSKEHPPNPSNNQASHHRAASQPSGTQLPFNWDPLQNLPNTPVLPRPGAESGRLLQPHYPSFGLQATGSIRTSQHSDLGAVSSSTTDHEVISKPAASARAPTAEPQESDSNRLKNIEDSIHCFWLASEYRMTQVQEELNDVSARLRGAVMEQEQMSSQMAQILPLQVEITQKVVRAAEDRRIIFGRIKLLEESSAAWQRELKTTLEAMQAEFRAGMEMVQELAAKGRKPPPVSKAKSDVAAAATASAATTATTTSNNNTTTTATKNNKRASPPRKKTSPTNGKKAKLPSADDGQTPPLPSSSVAITSTALPDQERPEPSQEIRQQQQQPTYDHQQQQQHYSQLRPHPAAAWSHEHHSQSLSQPMLPSHRDLSFDSVQLVPRPHTATPYLHDQLDMSLRH